MTSRLVEFERMARSLEDTELVDHGVTRFLNPGLNEIMFGDVVLIKLVVDDKMRTGHIDLPSGFWVDTSNEMALIRIYVGDEEKPWYDWVGRKFNVPNGERFTLPLDRLERIILIEQEVVDNRAGKLVLYRTLTVEYSTTEDVHPRIIGSPPRDRTVVPLGEEEEEEHVRNLIDEARREDE